MTCIIHCEVRHIAPAVCARQKTARCLFPDRVSEITNETTDLGGRRGEEISTTLGDARVRDVPLLMSAASSRKLNVISGAKPWHANVQTGRGWTSMSGN